MPRLFSRLMLSRKCGLFLTGQTVALIFDEQAGKVYHYIDYMVIDANSNILMKKSLNVPQI